MVDRSANRASDLPGRRVVVVGSGLAGLSCAAELVNHQVQVTLLTPGRLGRDGATQRVHVLAPWILINAPCQRGDSPDRFFHDLLAAGKGLHRPGVTEVFAEEAPRAAHELLELLDLVPLGEKPVLLPGNSLPRGRRCLPRGRRLLLHRLVTAIAGQVGVHERALAVGFQMAGERLVGVWAWHRPTEALQLHRADAVVLACGGVGAVFPASTGPRWCRGSALALGSLASALLHNPHVTQALPVLGVPPVYFPTTAALLKALVGVGEKVLPPVSDLESLTQLLAAALRAGQRAWVELAPGDEELLPSWVREIPRASTSPRFPLTLAVHHGVGGVAIDSWGRTSVPGLYACGEAAGGVQGAKRLMGTGLLEARVFGKRAARAVIHDLPKRDPVSEKDGVPRLVPCPVDTAELELHLDQWMGALAVIRPKDEVDSYLRLLARWPQTAREESLRTWLAAIRRAAAQAILMAQQKALASQGEEVPRELAG
ncbi:MAG: FAD-dependent oxidoreductase [Thermoanaerobaculum sp.]|nr:FAD-dependent oxidoreductase [Thermoanaerobaculum sp.]MDW7967621.1 FAD-dependent oxidoreductase [Thermoanaerobaculum sp.]